MEIPPGTDLSQIPFVANPDGSPPNFVDPPSLKAVTYAVTIILMVISFLLVLFRVRIHLAGHSKFAFDDCELDSTQISSSLYVEELLMDNRFLYNRMGPCDRLWCRCHIRYIE